MLTAQQQVDIRRWLGYPILNAGFPDTVFTIAYSHNYFPVSLTLKLTQLSAEEQATLVNVFLGPLSQLEYAIPGAADNMDTLMAGPWTANPNEVTDRSLLFNKWRRDLAAFLGFKPGPGLGGGGAVFVRA